MKNPTDVDASAPPLEISNVEYSMPADAERRQSIDSEAPAAAAAAAAAAVPVDCNKLAESIEQLRLGGEPLELNRTLSSAPNNPEPVADQLNVGNQAELEPIRAERSSSHPSGGTEPAVIVRERHSAPCPFSDFDTLMPIALILAMLRPLEDRLLELGMRLPAEELHALRGIVHLLRGALTELETGLIRPVEGRMFPSLYLSMQLNDAYARFQDICRQINQIHGTRFHYEVMRKTGAAFKSILDTRIAAIEAAHPNMEPYSP